MAKDMSKTGSLAEQAKAALAAGQLIDMSTVITEYVTNGLSKLPETIIELFDDGSVLHCLGSENVVYATVSDFDAAYPKWRDEHEEFGGNE